MYCKHCGMKISAGENPCPHCGKSVGSNVWKIVLMALAGVLVVAIMAGVVYVGTNGWPKFGSTEPEETTSATQGATTPTDGNPDDVSCKGSYTGSDEAVIAAKDTVIATVDGHTLTNGQLQVYYWMSVADFLNYYGSYLSYIGMDYTQPLDQQLFDEETGQSWQQYFLETALDSWLREQVLTAQAEEAGYQIDSAYQEYLDGLYEALQDSADSNGFESVEAMLQSDMGAAADFESYQYYVHRYYTGNLYFDVACRELEVTAEEMEAYFEENADYLESSYGVTEDSEGVIGLQYILLFPEGATSDTVESESFDQEAWDTAKAEITALLDAWVADGATEEGFLALMKGDVDDSGDQGGLSPWFSSSVDVRHVLIEPEEDTEDAWEACRQKAQALLDEWIIGGASEEAFAAMAKEYTADGNGDEGGLYEGVTKDYMVEAFDAWIFDESRQEGDYGLVKTEFGYHIMYFVHGDTAIDRWAFDESRQVGDYAVLESDYGYYLVRFTGADEAWAYYSRQGVQAEKLNELIQQEHTMEVSYSDILLAEVSLG